jgi:hypothetical protein
MSAHTPGPWEIRPGPTGSHGDEIGRRFPDARGRRLWSTVARVNHPDGAQTRALKLGVGLEASLATMDANARMIAAAPELLGALEHAEGLMGSHSARWEHEVDEESGQHDEDCRACEYDALLEHLRTALAKVRP